MCVFANAAANPGLAGDPSAGELEAAADEVLAGLSDWDVHSIRSNSTPLAHQGGSPFQGGSERTPREAEKVPVGVEDEKDMLRLLGDLAATIQLHV